MQKMDSYTRNSLYEGNKPHNYLSIAQYDLIDLYFKDIYNKIDETKDKVSIKDCVQKTFDLKCLLTTDANTDDAFRETNQYLHKVSAYYENLKQKLLASLLKINSNYKEQIDEVQLNLNEDSRQSFYEDKQNIYYEINADGYVSSLKVQNNGIWENVLETIIGEELPYYKVDFIECLDGRYALGIDIKKAVGINNDNQNVTYVHKKEVNENESVQLNQQKTSNIELNPVIQSLIETYQDKTAIYCFISDEGVITDIFTIVPGED